MRMRIVPFVLLIGMLISPLCNLRADDESVFDRIRREHEGIEKAGCGFCGAESSRVAGLLTTRAQPASLQPIDVKHYRLQISLDPDRAAVSGRVTVTSEATSAVSSIDLDVA